MVQTVNEPESLKNSLFLHQKDLFWLDNDESGLAYVPNRFSNISKLQITFVIFTINFIVELVA